MKTYIITWTMLTRTVDLRGRFALARTSYVLYVALSYTYHVYRSLVRRSVAPRARPARLLHALILRGQICILYVNTRRRKKQKPWNNVPIQPVVGIHNCTPRCVWKTYY